MSCHVRDGRALRLPCMYDTVSSSVCVPDVCVRMGTWRSGSTVVLVHFGPGAPGSKLGVPDRLALWHSA